jgi:hypothetical protein
LHQFLETLVFFILLSAFLDELWARQEKVKTFNWLSLLDEIVVGAKVGITLGYLSFLQNGGVLFRFPWLHFWVVFGSAVVLALVLEMVRPCRPSPAQLGAGESQALKEELSQRLQDNSPFVFWDYQNPGYVSVLTTVLPLVMMAAAAFSWFSQPWLAVLLAIVGAIQIIPYGGQRTLVTRQDITVRWGIAGLRVLRLKMPEVAGFEMHEFAPLRDFGGYGIRFNREMKAYFLRGTRGVKLAMKDGKQYLIGSDRPERLITVLQVITTAQTPSGSLPRS